MTKAEREVLEDLRVARDALKRVLRTASAVREALSDGAAEAYGAYEYKSAVHDLQAALVVTQDIARVMGRW